MASVDVEVEESDLEGKDTIPAPSWPCPLASTELPVEAVHNLDNLQLISDLDFFR